MAALSSLSSASGVLHALSFVPFCIPFPLSIIDSDCFFLVIGAMLLTAILFFALKGNRR